MKRNAISANCISVRKMWYRVVTESNGEEAKKKPKMKYTPSEANESVRWRRKG